MAQEKVKDGISSKQTQPYSDILINEEGMTLQEGLEANPMSIPGFKQTTNFHPNYAMNIQKKKKKKLIAKVFSNLSRLGMDYEDDVIGNMRAIPANKNLLPKDFQLQNQDLFTNLPSSWMTKQNADKNFFEKDYAQKRDVLRKLALQPELEDILDTMTNEAIVYDSNYTYFAEPYIDPNDLKNLTPAVQDEISSMMADAYSRLYKMLNWKTTGWDDFKRFLIDGILSYEIVYDSLEKPTKIIGLIPIDPATLTKKYDNGKWYWIQYKGVQGRERQLLDSQMIYIAYQETNCITRISYLERLIRPFNIYRIIEQAQLIWTITNASYKMQFTIPTRGMNRVLAQQTLMTAMNKYREDIKFEGETGELTVNGRTNLPFNKEYWLQEGESGTPTIENLGGDGPELNDNDQLKYFKNQLYKISKIPLSRFDQESGETWFGTDASSVARVEIDFGRFVTRLRNIFAQIILKPLQIQMAISKPELADMKELLNSIQLHFKSYNLFEEMMEMELMQKRVEFIQTMKDGMVDMDKDGNEIKFWSSEFLVKKYLHLSDADLKLNTTLKQQEIEAMNLAGNNSGGDDEEGGMEAKKETKKDKKKIITDSPKDEEPEINKEEE